MTTIEETLSERGKRYGGFAEHARITQAIKQAMADSPNWATLPADMRETLEMIAHKAGRILNGDPMFHDSWHDIVGYTKLVADRLLPPATSHQPAVEIVEWIGDWAIFEGGGQQLWLKNLQKRYNHDIHSLVEAGGKPAARKAFKEQGVTNFYGFDEIYKLAIAYHFRPVPPEYNYHRWTGDEPPPFGEVMIFLDGVRVEKVTAYDKKGAWVKKVENDLSIVKLHGVVTVVKQ
jgi:hypothetical protein